MNTISAVYRAIRWPAGLLYIALWIAALSGLGDGSALAGYAGCQQSAVSLVKIWLCAPDSGGVWPAAATNFVSLFTIQAPLVLIAGLMNPVLLLATVTLALGHAVGLPCAAFVLSRTLAQARALLRSGR